MKRLFDICSASIALVLCWPLLLFVALLIPLYDGGPVLFRQTRLGRGMRPFSVYKFRTMQDGEITRIGYWLRATGIDELPQFVNVLRGEMSGVGPRPLTEQDVVRLGWDQRGAAARFRARPGMTGLAQLYAGTSARRSLACDRLYCQHPNVFFDASIITWSVLINVLGKQRVRRWLARRRTGSA